LSHQRKFIIIMKKSNSILAHFLQNELNAKQRISIKGGQQTTDTAGTGTASNGGHVPTGGEPTPIPTPGTDSRDPDNRFVGGKNERP
jgi:hypothetical protein